MSNLISKDYSGMEVYSVENIHKLSMTAYGTDCVKTATSTILEVAVEPCQIKGY